MAALLLGGFFASAQYKSVDLSSLYDSEVVTALKEHVSILASAEADGRKAGSEGEAFAAEYVGKTLSSYGVELITPESGEPFGVVTSSGDTLTSHNVAAFIQGVDNSFYDRYIVIGARLDNLGSDTYTVDGEKVRRIYYGANGNASGLAMLLELARAFGASNEKLAGSWYFLNRSFSDAGRIDAMVNLDMLGTGTEGFYAYTSSNADMNMTLSSMKGEILPIVPEITAIEPYPSDHMAFYDKEIPSVMFTTGRYPEHNTGRDTPSILDYGMMEKELEFIYNYVISLSGAPKPLFRPDVTSAATSTDGKVISFNDIDVRPTFMGSSDPSVFMEKWVYQYLKYPKEALDAGNQGRVLVDFVVDASGNVKDVKVSRGVSPALDEEAIRIVSASPKWKPGRHRGKKVSTSITIAVEFRLEKKSKVGVGFNGKRIK